jgi:hypothetical protein
MRKLACIERCGLGMIQVGEPKHRAAVPEIGAALRIATYQTVE